MTVGVFLFGLKDIFHSKSHMGRKPHSAPTAGSLSVKTSTCFPSDKKNLLMLNMFLALREAGGRVGGTSRPHVELCGVGG